MPPLALFRVTGEMDDFGEDEYLVCAESAEDAKIVWIDPTNGGDTPEDGFTYKGVEAVSPDEVMEFGGGDDGWEGHLPEGAMVVSRYEDGVLGGQPDRVKASAVSWAAYFGRTILTDPNV